MRSKYRGQYSTVDRHIVVCCDPECTGVELFLHEFLHPDHGVSNIQVVLLVPSEPSHIFKELVVKYAKTQRVRYLRGDLLSNEDLLRVRLDVAIGCFILADKHSRNPDATDAMTVLRAISAHNYRPLMRTIVQLIEPRNKQYLTAVGISESNIVCIDQLRMRIAAQGCLIPGFATLFANLITSLSTERVGGWMGDYMHGLDQETYAEELPEWFVGCRYSDVAMSVYHEYGVLLIGVVLHDYVHVVLNPGRHFKIRSGDIGLFLTSNTAHLDEMLGDELEVKIPAEIKEFAAARVRQFTKAWRKACEGISTTWNRDELREASKREARRPPPLKRACTTPHIGSAKAFMVEATLINPSPAATPPPPPPPRVRPIELPLAPPDEAVCVRRELVAGASEGSDEREGGKWRRHSTDTVHDTRQRDAVARGDPPVRRWSEGMASALSPESVAYMQSRWPSRSTRATRDSNLRSLSAWLAGAINTRPQRRTKSSSAGRCKPGRSTAYLDEDHMRLRRSLTEPKPFVWQRKCAAPAAAAPECSVNLQKSKKTVRDAIASRLKRGTSIGYAAANSKWTCLQQLAAANQLKDYQQIGGRSQHAVSRTVDPRAIDTALLHCANNGEVQLTGHIVIVCPTLAGLVDFIAPLRQPSVTSRSIVIVCTSPTVPVSTEMRRHWVEICQFADVSVLASKGETTLHEDLVRAAVSHAAAVVVLSLAAHALQYSSPIARTIDSIEITMRRDARTVLATLEVEKRCPQETQIICELHNGKVLRQLSAGVRMETMTEKVRRETNSLKQQLQTGKWMEDSTEEPKGLLSILDEYSISTQDFPEMVPSYMSGKIMLSDMCDKLASQAFFNPHIMPMMSALLNPSLHNHRAPGAMQALTTNGQPLLQSAHLCAIEIPEDFISLCQGQPQHSNDSNDDVGPRMEWGYLWDFLMEEFSAIGLAVFVTEESTDSSWSIATRRDAFSQEGVCSAFRRRMSTAGSRARATSTESSSRNPSKSASAFGPYVVTNPERSFKLRKTDCVYCFLSPRLLATKRLAVLEGLQNTRASRAAGHTTSHQRNLSRVSIAQSTKRLESPDRLNDASSSSSSTRPRARHSVSLESRPAWGRPSLRRTVPSSPPASPPALSDSAARPPPASAPASSLGLGSNSGAECDGGLEAEVRRLRERLAAEQRRADELDRLLQMSLQAQGETRPACLQDGTSGEAGASAGERWW
ncbi:hypothetical protein AB1Y20_002615 [Prymnesium parvum]|uniref:Calcium-activated potassium channel BK alpha subunit domain-containing protein n=1 Tax=Prymnesium parvum TaxID=97485 RepID=A0AB34JCA7_PRYPA